MAWDGNVAAICVRSGVQLENTIAICAFVAGGVPIVSIPVRLTDVLHNGQRTDVVSLISALYHKLLWRHARLCHLHLHACLLVLASHCPCAYRMIAGTFGSTVVFQQHMFASENPNSGQARVAGCGHQWQEHLLERT
ncbi:unnamed protein product [Ostreobium quekettii]|uniref:Uncharacterized protein n=1 Tax=Ostreobium quekettii TaxID=121088 RepID=A0A8S1JGF1_9CHLO|nr:unnamed protein product [Ostreobium quekettii]